jgi:hypothetical protein
MRQPCLIILQAGLSGLFDHCPQEKASPNKEEKILQKRKNASVILHFCGDNFVESPCTPGFDQKKSNQLQNNCAKFCRVCSAYV